MFKEEKISIVCKVDEDIDEFASIRCDISKNDKKIGDFNLTIDPKAGKIRMDIKGKELIEQIGK